MTTVNLCLRDGATEYPARLTLRENGTPSALNLIDASTAPIEFRNHVELVSAFMRDGAWAAVRVTASSSPRFLPIVERVVEACGSRCDNEEAALSQSTEEAA